MFDRRRRAGAWLGSAGVCLAGLTSTVPWPVALAIVVIVIAYLSVDRVLLYRETMAAIAKTADGSPPEGAAAVVRALRAPTAPTRRQLTE